MRTRISTLRLLTLVCALHAACFVVSPARAVSVAYDAGYRFERVERIPYDAKDPLRSEFDYGRLAALAHLGDAAVTINEDIRFGVLVGSTTLEVHTGEGETFEYDDSYVFGLHAAYTFPELGMPDLTAEIGCRYLTVSSEDERVTYVSRDEVSDDGDAEIEWKELKLFAACLYRVQNTRFRCALEYVKLDVEQRWVFDLGKPSQTTVFDPEKNVGVTMGVIHEFSDHWAAFADVSFMHRVAFGGGVRCSF